MYNCRVIFRLILACVVGLLASQLQAADIKQWSERAETGENQQVLEEINQYLTIHPDDYAAQFLQGRLQAKQGDMQAAIDTYQRLIKLQPTQPEAYNNLAAIYAQQGDYAQAQHLLEQAIKTSPSYAAVYENLGQLYVEKARSAYGKALQLETGKPAVALQELKRVSGPATLPPSQLAEAQPAALATATPTVSDDAKSKALPTDEKFPGVGVATETKPAAPAEVATTVSDDAKSQQLPTDEKFPAVAEAEAESPAKFDPQPVITTLQGWAAAWSEQAIDVYLIFYVDNFTPEGMSHTSWEQERRARLQKPDWIKIGLSDFKVRQTSKDEVEVQMIQEYRASNYQDKTKKRMRLRETPDGWRITAEQTLAELR